MRVLMVTAMEAEARPLLESLAAGSGVPLSPLPSQVFAAPYRGLDLRVVVAGRDPRFGADSIGTIPAALATHAALTSGPADLVVSAGTAGGWRRHDTAVLDVFLAWDRFVFHDHRIPLTTFARMGEGHLPAADLRSVAARAGWKTGIVTTGDSLDESPTDRETIERLGGRVKEMEAAAAAWVAGLHETPVTALKVITDLVDDPAPTAEQFTANLAAASRTLTESAVTLLDHLAER